MVQGVVLYVANWKVTYFVALWCPVEAAGWGGGRTGVADDGGDGEGERKEEGRERI